MVIPGAVLEAARHNLHPPEAVVWLCSYGVAKKWGSSIPNKYVSASVGAGGLHEFVSFMFSGVFLLNKVLLAEKYLKNYWFRRLCLNLVGLFMICPSCLFHSSSDWPVRPALLSSKTDLQSGPLLFLPACMLALFHHTPAQADCIARANSSFPWNIFCSRQIFLFPPHSFTVLCLTSLDKAIIFCILMVGLRFPSKFSPASNPEPGTQKMLNGYLWSG